MGIAYLEQGQHIELNKKLYRLDREITKSEWQLECVTTGRYEIYTRDKLLSFYENGEMKFIINTNKFTHEFSENNKGSNCEIALDLLPVGKRDKAKIRHIYVKAILNAELNKYTEATINPEIEAVHKKLMCHDIMPHWSSVNRWRKKFLDGGNDIRALVSQDHKKGNRTFRYDTQIYEIVDKAINVKYMTREQGSINDAYEHAIYLVEQENKFLPDSMHLPHPTCALVSRQISKIPAFERIEARRGRQAAIREFRAVLSEVTATKPLERVEIDHTLLDILVLDEDMFPLGRPTLTICIDVMSRCILGVYIGFEPPSYLTVAQCLRHAFLPKKNLHKKFPMVKNDWEPFGVMQVLVVDNGLEFHGDGLDALCLPFGIKILYTPRKTPWYKGIVERVIGTMNRGVAHGNPGTTFKGILEKEDYDAAKKATITLSTLREIVNIWVVDYYHQRIHGTLEAKPIQVWRDNIEHIAIPFPTDVNDLDSMLGAIAERCVTHKGVELNKLTYNSKELRDMRMLIGPNFKATIRYNQADLGYIYVIDPNSNKPLRVPALNMEYADGLSEYQHKLCKRYAREYMEKNDMKALSEAKAAIHELILGDKKDKRIKTRARAYRATVNADQNVSPRSQVAMVSSPRAIPPSPASNTRHESISLSVNESLIERMRKEDELPKNQSRMLKVLIDD